MAGGTLSEGSFRNASQKSYLYQPHKIADCSKSDSPSNEQKVLIFWFKSSAAFDVEMSPSAWDLKTSVDMRTGTSLFTIWPSIVSPGSSFFQPCLEKIF